VERVEEKKTSDRILGIGAVAPGPIDATRCRILTPVGLEAYHGFSVAELGERLGLSVILERDAAALAIAEKRAVGARASFLVLLADHGLGGGFIYNGRRFGTAEGYGCEIGHTPIDANGPLCSCGNRGCAELYASVPATLARAAARGASGDYATLVRRAREGDEVCRTAIREQATALSNAAVGAVNMLEPERILLEGELAEACDLLAPTVEEALAARCFTKNGRAVRVQASTLRENGRAVAAANLILESFFEGDGTK
jgi:predicted NBD/HSP70 family sugar kinase